MMPEIDLEPHEYRGQRSRRNANFHGLLALVAGSMLAWVWWIRADLSPEAVFVGAAITGAMCGAGLIVFLNQWRGV